MTDAASEKSPENQGLLNGFRQFLMRGNVVDLAVAVVVGAAFSSIVNSVVKGVINPVVGAFGTQDLANYKSCLTCAVDSAGHTTHGVYILWGSVVSAALNFLITAAVVYFLMVVPMARYLARRAAKQDQEADKQAEQEAEADATEIALLREIRDALMHQRGTGALVDQRGPSDLG